MAVTAVTQNIAQYIGEDKTLQDTVLQADGITPQNISAWTINFFVIDYNDPTAIYITKTTVNGGIIITNPVGGVLQIIIKAADTVGMNPGQYRYRIERVDFGFDGIPTNGLFTLIQK